MKLRSLAAAVLLTSSSGFCLAAGQDTSGDCTKFVDGWKAAYNAQDAAALAGMYDAKSGRYSNAFWTAEGRAALTDAFQHEFAMKPHMQSIVCESSRRYNDTNVATGTYAAMAKAPSGVDMPMQGHWSAIALVRDGKYLIVNHVANMQMPTGK